MITTRKGDDVPATERAVVTPDDDEVDA